jgi:indolepyruvate ferredoxin oxidoreductase, alpha subunit
MKIPPEKMLFLSGDEALALGAYEQGLRVACSYPGTPASEVLEYLSRFSEIDAQWSVNEKVAFEVALGSAIAGLRSLYASKHVGLNVAMDPLMTSAYTGVNAGFVVVFADDPGIHSSQNEQDSRIFAKAAKMPLLEPASPAEAKDFAKAAFEISERFDTPVLIRLTTRVAHTKENVAAGQRVEVPAKEFKVDIPKYVMVPGNAYRKHLELEKRLIKLKVFSERSRLNTAEYADKRIGFVTSGISYQYIKEMFPAASVLKLGMSYPFPAEKVREFSRKVRRLYVIEELEPFLEEQILAAAIRCTGKPASYRVGELRPEYLPAIVKGREKVEQPSTSRKPVMCPGCPHRAMFLALKKIKAVVAGDIGCYTLGALPPLSSLHSCLCMGGGVTLFEGFHKAAKNAVGVIGDSTFVHSGVTGLINLAYNGTKGVLIILDNSTTAMTGSQPHPATGVTIKGQPTKKLSLEELCKACGADNVDVIDPFDVKAAQELVVARMGEGKLSVIISRYPCKLIDRTRRAAPVYEIDKCKKCGQCFMLNCPALTKTEGGLVAQHTELCAGCNLCAEVCSFGALKKQ